MKKWAFLTLISSSLLLPMSAQAAAPALGGNCAVCLFKGGKLVPGKHQHKAVFDRQAFYFPSENELKIFQTNPVKYAPALAGDCVVCLVEMGKRVSGKAQYWTKYDNRLYLFPGEKQLNMFKANPAKYAKADIGLQCYCPVCLIELKKFVPGDPKYVSVYDGYRYFLPSATIKQKFDANPAKYVPALAGQCPLCLKKGGKHVQGSIQHGAFYKGRSYLLPNAKIQDQFVKNPEPYAFVDLANDGNCIVCEKKLGKKVPGKQEFIAVYKHKLYRFPGVDQKNMFEAAPEQYVGNGGGAQPLPPVPNPPPKKNSGGNPVPVKQQKILVVGKTACAGCDYGKAPLTKPNNLGLAVVTPNNKVYIVEGAKKLYPAIYDTRFDAYQVQLQGTIRQQQGNFIWIDPVALTKVK